jgi:hypothetical protein
MTSARKSDERFRQLMDLAEGGNAEAVADLWLEFGFIFSREAT